MRPLNPYISGNPIAGEQGFFGREDILRQVERTLAAPGQNAVVLFGQRRIGKTSVLLQLQRRLASEQFTAVYQDLMDKATRPMGEVLRDLARSIALELGLDEPKQTFDDEGRAFQREFLPQAYAALPSPEHHLVLLFDEFDVLDVLQRERLPGNAAAKQLFQTLRHWLLEEPRLEFAFALGRDPKDLENPDFLATFKVAQKLRISVLEREATRQLITAPANVIRYTGSAVERLYTLTNGHPYFTQLLCQLVFDELSATSSPSPVTVDETLVDKIVPLAFQVGDNVFAWIWDGLPPAERIIAAALAELLPDDSAVASRAEILNTLQTRRVRVITRELETSPEKLVERQLLHRTGEETYRFLVPMLRRWIRDHKPLSLAQDELDRINPRADRYYRLGQEELGDGKPEIAAGNFLSALRVNPEHLQARLDLAETYLEVGKLDQAVETYDEAFKRDDTRSRAGLVKALWARVAAASSEQDALADVERILELQPTNQAALERRAQLHDALKTKLSDWARAAEQATLQQDWAKVQELALKFKEADPQGQNQQSSRITHLAEVARLGAEADNLLEGSKWKKAISLFEEIVRQEPSMRSALALARRKRRTALWRLTGFICLLPGVCGLIGGIAGDWVYPRFSSLFLESRWYAVGMLALIFGLAGLWSASSLIAEDATSQNEFPDGGLSDYLGSLSSPLVSILSLLAYFFRSTELWSALPERLSSSYLFMSLILSLILLFFPGACALLVILAWTASLNQPLTMNFSSLTLCLGTMGVLSVGVMIYIVRRLKQL